MIRTRRFLLLAAMYALIWSILSTPALADILGDLSVHVREQTSQAPIRGVAVSIQAAGRQETVVTDETGTAVFQGLPIGGYSIKAEKPGWVTETSYAVIRENATSDITLNFEKTGKELGVTVSTRRLLMNARDTNGSSTYIDKNFMQTRMAHTHLFQSVANMSPGVSMDSEGQLHFRGEHRSESIAIDGVMLPIPLLTQVGSLVDPVFLQEVEVRTGSFDPTFGAQLGGVLNLVTLNGGKKPEGTLLTEVGNLGIFGIEGTAGGSGPGNRFHYFIGADTRHTDLRTEAPNPYYQTLNNQGDDADALLHVVYDADKHNLSLTLSSENLRMQIPNTPIAQAAGVNQLYRENNVLGVLAWRARWSADTESLLGFSFLDSHQGVFHNGVFTPWTPADPLTMPHAAAAGLPLNPEDPGSPYLPTLSRGGEQKLAEVIITHKFSDANTLRFGGNFNFLRLSDAIDIIDAGGAGQLPGGVPRYSTRFARSGFDGGIFAGDTLSITTKFTVNFGFRADAYSNGISVNTRQISPLFNFAYAFSPTSVLRWSYDHLFTAPPIENDPTGSSIVLPERTTDYELSYEKQLARDLVFRIGAYLKNYDHPLDLSLLVSFSNLPVFVPINFPKGQTVGEELSLMTNRPAGFNWFFNFSGTSMHILEPYPGTAEIPLVDHFENVLSRFGLSYAWENGAHVSVDNEYGSGFPQDAIGAYNADHIYPFGIHGTQSRFITNLNIGWNPKDASLGGSLEILNLFDSRRLLNLLSNFSGTRFVEERQIVFSLTGRF